MPALRTRDNTQTQTLEVRTDKPSLPSLAIIAPTPKTFTFPVSHSLDISPYSTPSNSPFEPDFNSLELASPASSCLPTPPPLSRTLSPDSSVSLSSPSYNRKSESLDAERRPKRGDDGYIKRPENAFILFRRKCCEDSQRAEDEAASGGPTRKQRQADLSKTISHKWKTLSTKDRQYWEDLAKEKKKEHQQMYPDYVYRPQRVRDQAGKARNKKYTKRSRGRNAQHDADADGETAYVVSPRPISRSNSAPTPSYHTIHIPTVFARPSCPSSPSLVPMITRRAAYSGAAENIMSNFDYFPSNRSSDPMQQAGLEAGLQNFAQFSPTDSCDPDQQVPSDLNVQMGTDAIAGSSYPWNPNAIWQTEPSMLMGNDFNLDEIPPIELKQGIFNYGDDAAFGISPEATSMAFLSRISRRKMTIPSENIKLPINCQITAYPRSKVE
ncbi:hypothetical protein BT96DRAFT_915505 [Gymnopus androsaceus JB14]|uniref:HMG box domain-containing protein n=1 Tax=Gymnopus androsaceus JB14 TaxID=1447944 RepID=A0A6A4IBV7_9AGAR|nr:hypothetical protein BT96DRAFT_915505 [Gymnopus androsaceus JB14]